jgi:hypothetical protein
MFIKNVLLVGFLVVALAGCRSDKGCREILVNKCSSCHGLSTSCAKVGEGYGRWLGIIDAMNTLHADVSEKERKVLAKCLSEPSAVTDDICR